MPYAKRSILPGYPKEFVFQTRDQIDRYLGDDRVACLLCGHKFRILETHLRGVHQMTGDEYRERYGLPYERGLCGASFSAQRVQHGRDIWEQNTDRQSAALASAKAKQAALGANPQRGKPTFWKRERSGDGATHRKLTEAQVIEIRAKLARGEDKLQIATAYGVTPQNINTIRQGRTWRTASVK